MLLFRVYIVDPDVHGFLDCPDEGMYLSVYYTEVVHVVGWPVGDWCPCVDKGA